jgi:hypothetical protein
MLLSTKQDDGLEPVRYPGDPHVKGVGDQCQRSDRVSSYKLNEEKDLLALYPAVLG